MKDGLYILNAEKPLPKDEFRSLTANLPAERAAHITAFSNPREAHSALYSSLLVQYALRKTAGIDEYISIDRDRHGKPYSVDYPDIHFNISHSGTRVLCGISASPIGVDIERIRPIDTETMSEVLSKPEREAVFGAKCSLDRFFTYWTIKESLFKFRGSGMGQSPSEVTVHICGRQVTLDSQDRVRFDRPFIAPGYKTAVCRNRTGKSLNIITISLETLIRFSRVSV